MVGDIDDREVDDTPRLTLLALPDEESMALLPVDGTLEAGAYCCSIVSTLTEEEVEEEGLASAYEVTRGAAGV